MLPRRKWPWVGEMLFLADSRDGRKDSSESKKEQIDWPKEGWMIGFARGPFGRRLVGRAINDGPSMMAPMLGRRMEHHSDLAGIRVADDSPGIHDGPRGTIAGPNPSASISPELQGCSFFVNALGLGFLPRPMMVSISMAPASREAHDVLMDKAGLSSEVGAWPP